jgi:uncharacterized protein (DUF427 family)
MKATWNGSIIAEAATEELIRIEGNWYFPPTSLSKKIYSDSAHRTTCFWKGEAHYYDITVDGTTNEFGAWYYPLPMDGSTERVKSDFTNYVGFWNGVEITA